MNWGFHYFEEIVIVYFPLNHGILCFEHFSDFLFWKLHSCDLWGFHKIITVDVTLFIFIVKFEYPFGWVILLINLGWLTYFSVFFKSNLVWTVFQLFLYHLTVVEFCGKDWSLKNDWFFYFVIILLLKVIKGSIARLGTRHWGAHNVRDGKTQRHN